MTLPWLSAPPRHLEEFLQIGDALLVSLHFLPTLVALLKLLLQFHQFPFRDMAIDHSPLLAGHEVVVGIFSAFVPLLSDVERPLGIPSGLL